MGTDNDIAIVLKFLRLEDRPEKADVIFILGGSTLSPVVRAAELYHSGYAPKIAFISIGGRFGGNHVWGIPEYIKYHETLLGLGIPEKSIISEGLSSNTLEEAKQAIPFLIKRGVLIQQMLSWSPGRCINEELGLRLADNGQRLNLLTAPLKNQLIKSNRVASLPK